MAYHVSSLLSWRLDFASATLDIESFRIFGVISTDILTILLSTFLYLDMDFCCPSVAINFQLMLRPSEVRLSNIDIYGWIRIGRAFDMDCDLRLFLQKIFCRQHYNHEVDLTLSPNDNTMSVFTPTPPESFSSSSLT